MSELPDGIAAAAPAAPLESAVTVVVRAGQAGWEVLLGLRSRRSRFFPLHWACPGGRLEPHDEPSREGAHARCAARELREETGLALAAADLRPIGVRITPPFTTLRYHSPFFVAVVSRDTPLPECPASPDEIEAQRFVPASAALADWRAGTIRCPPPLPPVLRTLAGAPCPLGVDELAQLMLAAHERDAPAPRQEMLPGTWFFTVRTPTLPPATHTTVWMPGGSRCAILDPGCDDPAELEALAAVIARRAAEGCPPAAIVLTHHHRDHVLGAAALARRFALPVLAHPATLARVALDAGIDVRGDLVEGAVLDLGGVRLVAHHTPGHAPGHVALALEGSDVVFAGDMVSAMSTIIVPPDGGEMGAYLRSLERLVALGAQRVLPAHGAVLPGAVFAQALAHRREREARILAALGAAPRPLAEIAAEAYADTPDAPAALAQVQTAAHVAHLARTGRAHEAGGGWAA